MQTIQPKGATYVSTQDGEALTTEATVGHLKLSNGVQVQVKRAWVVAATNDTTALVPAVATATIRVLSCFLLGGATAPTVTFKSASTAISPPFTHAINGGMVLPPNIWGWFQTLAINEALNVTVSSSADVGVIINYIEITDDLFNLL